MPFTFILYPLLCSPGGGAQHYLQANSHTLLSVGFWLLGIARYWWEVAGVVGVGVRGGGGAGGRVHTGQLSALNGFSSSGCVSPLAQLPLDGSAVVPAPVWSPWLWALEIPLLPFVSPLLLISAWPISCLASSSSITLFPSIYFPLKKNRVVSLLDPDYYQ